MKLFHISMYAVPLFVTALLFGSLGTYVYLNRRGSPGNQVYAIWCYFTVHWHLCWGLLFSLKSPESALTLIRIGYCGIIFLPIAFYHFVSAFLEDSGGLSLHVIGFYILGLIFAITVWVNGLFVKTYWKASWGYFPRVGPIHPFYLLLLGGLVFHGLSMLWKEIKRIDINNLRRAQTKCVMAACATYALACIDFLPNYGIDFYPFGYLFTLVSMAILVYGITKHRLLEISVVIRKTVVYALVTGIVAGIVVFVSMFSARVAEGMFGRQTLALVLATAVITAIVHPLQLKVQRFVDRYFFSGWADQPVAREIASGFSHELKSPLAGLSMQAQLMMTELEEIVKEEPIFKSKLSKIDEGLRYILKQAMDAARRIEAVRGVAEPTRGQLELVHLTDLLQNSLSVLRNMLSPLTTPIEINVPKSISTIYGDAKQLEIVFINLMKNALQAMDCMENTEGHALFVSGYETDRSIVISLRDTGPGIPYKDLPRIFEPYFTTKGHKGTGMGLYLSQQIVKAHGGSIDVKSEEGKGTEFRVTFFKNIPNITYVA